MSNLRVKYGKKMNYFSSSSVMDVIFIALTSFWPTYFSSVFSKSFHYSTWPSSIFSISFHTFLPYFPYHFIFQLSFLPYFPYHFTIQPTFLPYFSYLFTIFFFLKTSNNENIEIPKTLNWSVTNERTIWYGKYGRKVSWIVKWFGKYRRKLWKDMKNMEEK
jgi:hypothetical protein